MTWLLVRVMRLKEERPNCPPDERPTRSMQHWLDNLHSLGFETYYPMIRELRVVPKREMSQHQRRSNTRLMRVRVVPFLPQLVFVPADSRAGVLAGLPGVVGFFCDGDRPAQIRDTLVDNLKKREIDGVIPGGTPAEYIFSVGDKVEFLHSVLGMVPGKVELPPDCPIEQIDADTKLRLTVSMFGRETAVLAKVSEVRKV